MRLANGAVTLQSVANSLYVSTDPRQGAVLVANRPVPGTGEQFVIAGVTTAPTGKTTASAAALAGERPDN